MKRQRNFRFSETSGADKIEIEVVPELDHMWIEHVDTDPKSEVADHVRISKEDWARLKRKLKELSK